MKDVVAFGCGVLFALGLGIGGMTQPSRVLAFLDVAGEWDPSLAFVMAGAIGVYAPVYRLAVRRGRPILAANFDLPARRDLDSPLLAGAALFGVGWGLAGLCPGPALTSLASGEPAALAFVAAMLAGLAGARLATGRGRRATHVRRHVVHGKGGGRATRAVPRAFVAAFLLVLGAEAGAQSAAGGPGPRGRIYDPSSVETVAGEVISVTRGGGGGRSSGGVHLVLRTASGKTVSVPLGPTAWVDRQPIKITTGDRVEVTGSRVGSGDETAIVAAVVRKGRDTLVLRNQAGVPAWSGAGGGAGFP